MLNSELAQVEVAGAATPHTERKRLGRAAILARFDANCGGQSACLSALASKVAIPLRTLDGIQAVALLEAQHLEG